MKKQRYIFLLLVLAAALALAACGGSDATEPADGDTVTVPAEYDGLTNPLAGSTEAAAAGKDLYAGRCATCHGEAGRGDGAGGAALNPKPTDLTALDAASDGYIYWRIAEGGMVEPFKSQGSAMPAWKNVLSEEETWQLVTYIRTLE
ncbi:MAG: c-type cytochrome [Chloroflexota bacterium]